MGQAPALYGDAMVQLHSRRGFLRRLREGDRVIATVRDAWERPIRSLMHELGVPDDRFDETLFLYNALFDPGRSSTSSTQACPRRRRCATSPTRSTVPSAPMPECVGHPQWSRSTTRSRRSSPV
ncbi:hypothetical protein ACFQ0B_77735 [Nonomuraea thailandensis]